MQEGQNEVSVFKRLRDLKYKFAFKLKIYKHKNRKVTKKTREIAVTEKSEFQFPSYSWSDQHKEHESVEEKESRFLTRNIKKVYKYYVVSQNAVSDFKKVKKYLN